MNLFINCFVGFICVFSQKITNISVSFRMSGYECARHITLSWIVKTDLQ